MKKKSWLQTLITQLKEEELLEPDNIEIINGIKVIDRTYSENLVLESNETFCLLQGMSQLLEYMSSTSQEMLKNDLIVALETTELNKGIEAIFSYKLNSLNSQVQACSIYLIQISEILNHVKKLLDKGEMGFLGGPVSNIPS